MRKLLFIMLGSLVMASACGGGGATMDWGPPELLPSFDEVLDSARHQALSPKDSAGELLYDSAALYEAYFPCANSTGVDSFDLRFAMYKDGELKSYALVYGNMDTIAAEYSDCNTSTLSEGLLSGFMPYDTVLNRFYDTALNRLPYDSLGPSCMDVMLIVKDSLPEWEFIRDDSVIYRVR